MGRRKVSSTSEEYLEAIYKLEEKTGSAKTSDLARELQVKLGTITNTVESLEKEGLIIHKPYKGVKLTSKGQKIALSVIRKHRLSERLLTDILHLDWSRVHDVACKLEHAITKDVIRPLERALRYPKTCPHGSPIPTESGRVIEEKAEPLTNLDLRDRGTIIKVTEEKDEVLRYLATLGLIPGACVEVEEKAPFNGPIIVKVMGARYALGREIASVIYVKKGLI